MKVEFLIPARTELYEAVVFYNIQKQGLGEEFAEEAEDTITRIKENPEAWPRLASSTRTRRCLTNRFPYGIIYQIRKNSILVVAVMHQRRHPRSWRSRLPKSEH
ncbi:MAG: type II toxin-antitoxin system RelE/ParE family toxin [Thermodesulfobacteriota bacterium]